MLTGIGDVYVICLCLQMHMTGVVLLCIHDMSVQHVYMTGVYCQVYMVGACVNMHNKHYLFTITL